MIKHSIKVYDSPEKNTWSPLLARPTLPLATILETVTPIMERVKKEGDAALYDLTYQLDEVNLPFLQVPGNTIAAAAGKISTDLKVAIEQAAANIRAFHAQQLVEAQPIETMPGVLCWRRSVGIDKVGLYVPGGSAPLFSTVLMLGIPAQIAGCKNIVLCSPPDASGCIHPAILFAAQLVGINNIYCVGGAQAIAAMAYGTESIPAVYKIFGPGNQYVTAAKQKIQWEGVAIDMPAGPSEVCIWADDSAKPHFVAADLLSQAEHGNDSQVMLVAESREFVNKVLQAIEIQLIELPRQQQAGSALSHSRAVIFTNSSQALEFINDYAPEHLIIQRKDATEVVNNISNAGSVFIGDWSPESAGDYASGTNHTLPTNGYAKAWSGVSVDSFVKKITYQQISYAGLSLLGKTIITMANAEGLTAHARAVSIRLDDNNVI